MIWFLAAGPCWGSEHPLWGSVRSGLDWPRAVPVFTETARLRSALSPACPFCLWTTQLPGRVSSIHTCSLSGGRQGAHLPTCGWAASGIIWDGKWGTAGQVIGWGPVLPPLTLFRMRALETPGLGKEECTTGSGLCAPQDHTHGATVQVCGLQGEALVLALCLLASSSWVSC